MHQIHSVNGYFVFVRMIFGILLEILKKSSEICLTFRERGVERKLPIIIMDYLNINDINFLTIPHNFNSSNTLFLPCQRRKRKKELYNSQLCLPQNI